MNHPDDRDDVVSEVADYKRLLKAILDRRPSGTRKRLAAALGTHKSFVSQISNPAYRVAIPAQHVPTIVRVCHLSTEERRAFLQAYERAHPGQHVTEGVPPSSTRILIVVPPFRSASRQAQVVEAIEEMANRVIAIAQDAEGS